MSSARRAATQCGISLIEVLVVTALLVIGLWLMMNVFPVGQRALRVLRERNLARTIAERIAYELANSAKFEGGLLPDKALYECPLADLHRLDLQPDGERTVDDLLELRRRLRMVIGEGLNSAPSITALAPINSIIEAYEYQPYTEVSSLTEVTPGKYFVDYSRTPPEIVVKFDPNQMKRYRISYIALVGGQKFIADWELNEASSDESGEARIKPQLLRNDQDKLLVAVLGVKEIKPFSLSLSPEEKRAGVISTDDDRDGKVDEDSPDDDGDGKVDEDPVDEVNNDGDGKVDEDPTGGVDNDGDGKVDEDPSNWVDNDGDGKVDEDPVDGVDNDGDGKVDEDPLCQLHVSYKVGVDSDGDGKVDEDPLDGADNDGDGKVDEDPPDDFGMMCWGRTEKAASGTVFDPLPKPLISSETAVAAFDSSGGSSWRAIPNKDFEVDPNGVVLFRTLNPDTLIRLSYRSAKLLNQPVDSWFFVPFVPPSSFTPSLDDGDGKIDGGDNDGDDEVYRKYSLDPNGEKIFVKGMWSGLLLNVTYVGKDGKRYSILRRVKYDPQRESWRGVIDLPPPYAAHVEKVEGASIKVWVSGRFFLGEIGEKPLNLGSVIEKEALIVR